MNIPRFPEFKKITIHEQDFFIKFTRNILPYSDFNFVSLWSYNTEDDAEVSILHENIVIKFRDYLTNNPFYSFIGQTEVVKTIQDLLSYAEKIKIAPELKLIPETTLKGKTKTLNKNFHLQEDRDNFDYIISLEAVSLLLGRKFTNKKYKVNHFLRNYPKAYMKQIDLDNIQNHKHLSYVFSKWKRNGKKQDTHREFHAISRLLNHASSFNLITFGVYINDKLEAFTITELLPKKYAITHFTKADPKIAGIFEYLYQQVALNLIKRGYLYLNREQDLGLEGLRSAKLSWRPTRFLKKYTISKF